MVVNLFCLWGVNFVVVVGYFSGEIVVVYVLGVLIFDEVIIVVYFRGLVFIKEVVLFGVMVVVGFGRDIVKLFFIEGVVIVCENSLMSVILFGDRKKIMSVFEEI